MGAVELQHGHFAYVDLMAHDWEGSLTFYGELFGWTPVEMPTDSGYRYALFRQGEDDVAGIGEASPEMKASGAPPMWTSYILVDDVEAATSRAGELGGNVLMPPMEVGTAGQMSIIQDPTGGAVSLWEAVDTKGASIFNVPNSLAWNELVTKRPEEARTFFAELLGWDFEEVEMPEIGTYHMAMVGGRPNAGICNPPMVPDHVPTYWDVYFAVADVDAMAEKAVELGGKVLVPPKDIPVGRFAALYDPQGASFCVFTSSDAGGAEG